MFKLRIEFANSAFFYAKHAQGQAIPNVLPAMILIFSLIMYADINYAMIKNFSISLAATQIKENAFKFALFKK